MKLFLHFFNKRGGFIHWKYFTSHIKFYFDFWNFRLQKIHKSLEGNPGPSRLKEAPKVLNLSNINNALWIPQSKRDGLRESVMLFLTLRFYFYYFFSSLLQKIRDQEKIEIVQCFQNARIFLKKDFLSWLIVSSQFKSLSFFPEQLDYLLIPRKDKSEITESGEFSSFSIIKKPL